MPRAVSVPFVPLGPEFLTHIYIRSLCELLQFALMRYARIEVLKQWDKWDKWDRTSKINGCRRQKLSHCQKIMGQFRKKWDKNKERRKKVARKKCDVTVSMDKDMHTKLMLISIAQKYRLGQKNASMSSIIAKALDEYFVNHKEEFEKAINEVNTIWGEGIL